MCLVARTITSSLAWRGFKGWIGWFVVSGWGWGREESCTIKYEISQGCELTKFVILDFSKMFYFEKPILKVDILMTGIIHLTFIKPN